MAVPSDEQSPFDVASGSTPAPAASDNGVGSGSEQVRSTSADLHAPGPAAKDDPSSGAIAETPPPSSAAAPPAAPATDNGVSDHQAPPPPLNEELEREIDEAMRAAAGEPAAPDSPQSSAKAATGRKQRPVVTPHEAPAIRGPRVVEAGREHRSGRVVSIGPEDLFIEFGPKELGVAPRKQWPEEELPKVDTTLEVIVNRFDAAEQLYICSKPGAIQKAEWELLEPGQIVEARVSKVNKGGLTLEVAGHDAFMPASQVDVRRIPDLSIFVGEKVRCKIRKVDRRGRGEIVVSRRAIVAEEMKELRANLRESLKVGQSLEGVVRRIVEFGCFVDIGGIDGLVHISDLSYDRVSKVEDVVKVGETVTVQILKVDWEKERISLGVKQIQPDPWDEKSQALTEGETISGRVVKLMEFGVFVEIAPGVEGLIHISELSWERIARADMVVKPDQVIKVKVLGVDADRHRISLSLKQTTNPPASTMKRRRGGGREVEKARSVEEIRKETPEFRRLREQAAAKKKDDGSLKSGLGNVGGVGLGELGDLKLG